MTTFTRFMKTAGAVYLIISSFTCEAQKNTGIHSNFGVDEAKTWLQAHYTFLKRYSLLCNYDGRPRGFAIAWQSAHNMNFRNHAMLYVPIIHDNTFFTDPVVELVFSKNTKGEVEVVIKQSGIGIAMNENRTGVFMEVIYSINADYLASYGKGDESFKALASFGESGLGSGEAFFSCASY